MNITRTSILSRITRTRDIDITSDQYMRWVGGTPIQNAAPHLSADDREWLMTGITSEEWDATFRGNDDDEDDSAYHCPAPNQHG